MVLNFQFEFVEFQFVFVVLQMRSKYHLAKSFYQELLTELVLYAGVRERLMLLVLK